MIIHSTNKSWLSCQFDDHSRLISRSNYQTSIWWSEVSIKIVSSIHVLPGVVAGFGRTYGLGQMRRFKVHVILILMIQHCSYFNFTIKFSWYLGLDFTNIPRRHSPTLSSRHYWSKGQFNDLWNNDLSINDFVVPAMISQDFSDCSIQTSKSYFKSFYAKFRWRLQLTNAPRGWLFTIYAKFDQ